MAFPRHAPSERPRLLAIFLSGYLLLSALCPVSQAQVTLDGSLGPRGALTGPNYLIPSTSGQIRGPNLFHSFGQFNLSLGESATFTGPNTIVNILSRVTGGSPSIIDGLISSQIPGANFYLLNPSGVLFGPNARLDVSGSFHVSTADYLRLADGAIFSAPLAPTSTLSVAPPEAFGFLGRNPAPITIQGGFLQVREGKALSVIGGDVRIVGGALQAPSGRLQLASVASPGEVTLGPLALEPDLQVGTFTLLGRLELSQGALLDASGNGSGSVLLRGGHLLVDQSAMLANTVGNAPGARRGLDVQITADAAITRDSLLSASPLRGATGSGGSVEVHAGTLTLSGGSAISTASFGAGRGGTLTVTATDAIAITGQGSQGSVNGLFSNALSSGDAGRLSISAPTLAMDNSLMQAGTGAGSRGSADGATVRVGRLTLTGGAQIDTSTRGSGQGGTLSVTATDSLAIVGQDPLGNPSALSSNALGLNSASGSGPKAGNAGDLIVSAPVLTMQGGRITARTAGDGNAGNIVIQVGRLELTSGAQIFNGTGSLDLVNGVPTFTGTGGPGQGGNLTVSATEAIAITGSGSNGFKSGLFSNAQKGTGRAGDVFVSTPSLTMQGGLILASTEVASSGNAGSLTLTVGTLRLTDGAEISTSTKGSGQGGTITARITDTAQLQAGAAIDSSTTGTGLGGNITIQAQRLDLSTGGTIAARSTGTGAAGTIHIQADETFRSQEGAVTTEATQGGGGGIELRTGQLIQLRDSEVTTSVHGGGGDAGNLTLKAQNIVAAGSQIIANAFGGRGGNIGIDATVFLTDPTSLVSASSALGINGIVDIRAPITSISGAVAPLPQSFAPSSELLRDRCVARLRSGGNASRFVLSGRDGVPPAPGDLLPSSPGQVGPASPVRHESGHGETHTVRLVERGPTPTDQVQAEPWYAQALAPGVLELECTRWTGRQSPTGTRRR